MLGFLEAVYLWSRLLYQLPLKCERDETGGDAVDVDV